MFAELDHLLLTAREQTPAHKHMPYIADYANDQVEDSWLWFCVVAVIVLVSPMGCYLVHGAAAEARILHRRQSIADLVGDSATSPAVRAKLRVVLAARAFAAESLGLKARESFTTYSQLDRDTLVLVLSVATAKALFVMMYFMHLKFEGRWKYVLLSPTVILAIGLPLALLPDIGGKPS